MAVMLRPGQFTSKSLFIATALIAAVCALCRYGDSDDRPIGFFAATLLVPMLVAGAAGVLIGRLKAWICVGIIAAACALVRLFAATYDPMSRLLAGFGVPMLVCVAVVVLRRRLTAGLLLCMSTILLLMAWTLYVVSVASPGGFRPPIP